MFRTVQQSRWILAFKRTILVAGTVTCFVGANFALSSDQENPHRALLAEYVPPSLLLQTNDTAAVSKIIHPRARYYTVSSEMLQSRTRALTAGERWENFETEFGLRERNTSRMLGSVESAKYQLDKTLFAMQEFVGDVEEAVSFDYALRDIGRRPPANGATDRRVYDNLWMDAWQNARFKSDIDLDMVKGRAFVGVRLVLPLGY